MGPVSKHWGQLRLLNCILSPFVIGTASHLRGIAGHRGHITSHRMASCVVALRIAQVGGIAEYRPRYRRGRHKVKEVGIAAQCIAGGESISSPLKYIVARK
jgi:hypothetical protein